MQRGNGGFLVGLHGIGAVFAQRQSVGNGQGQVGQILFGKAKLGHGGVQGRGQIEIDLVGTGQVGLAAAAAGERKDKGQRQQAQCERLYMFHDFLPFFFAKNAS